MNKIIIITAILIVLVSTAFSRNDFYSYEFRGDDQVFEFCKERRERLKESLPPRSAAIVLSSGFLERKTGSSACGRENPDMIYLTGIDGQVCALLLSSEEVKFEGVETDEILFVADQSRGDALWNGPAMDIFDAEDIFGISRASGLDNLEDFLRQSEIDTVFVSAGFGASHFDYSGKGKNNANPEIFDCPEVEFIRGIPDLKKMREIKDSIEIAYIEKAVDITSDALRAAMKVARNGVGERELRAEIEYFFNKFGEGPAFPSIVGIGTNSCYLHYTRNDDFSKGGEIALIDCGARFAGYAADITRSFPVDGTFSDAQAELYDIVLEARDSAFAACLPGEPFSGIHLAAIKVIGERLVEIGLLEDASDYKRYFPHGTSHRLGLDVHDVSSRDTLHPGTVVTVEPGIYVPPGSDCPVKYHGIGIRIEDDVLITPTGRRVLSDSLPCARDEIERITGKNPK